MMSILGKLMVLDSIILFFDDVVVGLAKVVGVALYVISYTLFLIIDFLSIIFKSILGLGASYKINMTELGGEPSTTVGGDLVLTIIQSKTIQNIFWSLAIIALFLLFISVIIAIIRSEYRWDKEGNSKGPIFGKALKAIALFFTVPVACVFGIYCVSFLLKAVDQATGSDAGYVSSLVFGTCAAKGNRIRQNTNTFDALGLELEKTEGGASKTTYVSRFTFNSGNPAVYWTGTRSDVLKQKENLAKIIDGKFDNGAVVNLNSSYNNFYQIGVCEGLGALTSEEFDTIRSGFRYIRKTSTTQFLDPQVCSPYNIELVWFYYDLLPGGYDHILSLLVAFLLVKILFDMACGVVKRAYELAVLYAISPPIVALMPLDDGNAYKSWVKAFIGKTLMGFGGVLAINFFFMLVPVFKTIEIFNINNLGVTFFGGVWIIWFFNALTQLLFVLAGAYSLSSLSKMISGIIGAEDAAESGASISGAVGAMGGKLIGGAAGLIGKPLGMAKNKIKDSIKEHKVKKDVDKLKNGGGGALSDKRRKAAEEHMAKDQRSKEMKDLQSAEKNGNLSAEQRSRLEQMRQTDLLKSGSGGGGGGKESKDGPLKAFAKQMGTGLLSQFGGEATAKAAASGYNSVGNLATGAISGTINKMGQLKNWSNRKRMTKLKSKAAKNLGITGPITDLSQIDQIQTEMDRMVSASGFANKLRYMGLRGDVAASRREVNQALTNEATIAGLRHASRTDVVDLKVKAKTTGLTKSGKPRKPRSDKGVKRGPRTTTGTVKGTVTHVEPYGSKAENQANINESNVENVKQKWRTR